ncbi:MAG: acetyl-CoA carboxylase, carboxyltransferase subunit beta [Candidatus Aminicenantes bacterium]|nr:acetyl-CoA carboxylase, carboxyltransferase subunit beta [Candidatus Aminicenantes bacterium]
MPEGLWTKCEDCGETIYNKTLEEDLRICPKCDHHFNLSASLRVASLIDEGTFHEMDAGIVSGDPLKFRGPKSYNVKLKEDQSATGLKDAVITGFGLLNQRSVALGVTDSRFIMGSMGSVVGEKLTRLIERATEERQPLVIVSASGGGARMYEGMLSLMQMAKTSQAVGRHHEAGQLFISVLTNPTMAGIMASFASLGDLIIAEPRALIGFTGPRVIEQTIRQKLPSGFQTSEFLLEHGMIDKIIHRKHLKASLAQFIDLFCPRR